MLASSGAKQFLAGMMASLTFSSDQSSMDLSFASGKVDSDALYLV